MITFKKNYNKLLDYIIFIIFVIINFILMFYHEPWRDEIHAWTMAENLSIKDLFIVSRFDGHPVLWHLILMPFAKLNFPIFTLNIISWLIVCFSAWIFIFKTKLNIIFKYLVLFTIPFTYVYSAISRNYCLILLLLMIIGSFYDKRYSHPILYSILISLLIYTHSLAWGIVAGLTITFHIYELFMYLFKNKRDINIKPILVGFIIIVVNTILVVLQLYGSTNPDYSTSALSSNQLLINTFIMILFILMISFIIIKLFAKDNLKEYLIMLIGLLFQCLVYIVFYSSILLQRFMLVFVVYLFFIMLLSKTNIKKNYLNLFCVLYVIIMIVSTGLKLFYINVKLDIKYPYSSAQEMANYINTNLSNEDTILIDSSIICQTIEPYLEYSHLYDIVYNDYFENIKYMSNDNVRIYDALEHLNKYNGYYIIVSHNNSEINQQLIYRTSNSLIGETYTLYYIDKNK